MSMNREDVLEKVDLYSVEQLVGFIRQGVVTFEDLVHETGGNLSPSKRKQIRSLIENGDGDAFDEVKRVRTIEACQNYLNLYPEGKHRQEVRDIMDEIEAVETRQEEASQEETAWQNVDRKDLESVRDFIRNYPNSIHISEANRLVNTLLLDEIMDVDADTLVTQIHQIQAKNISSEMRNNQIVNLIGNFLKDKKITKKDFLSKIDDDHNLLSAGVIKQLVDNEIISLHDLLSINIHREFIQMMMNVESTHTFPPPEKLEKVNKQSTEVYFWGIPSSGKSCALGAILSVAANGSIATSMDTDIYSQGYGYMMRLINLFQNGAIGSLVTGTAIDAFYEMGFDLVDEKNRVHPITCIDMAGELMRCMYKSNAGEQMSMQDVTMLTTMTNVLIDNRSTNRKIHFFVIEYGAEDRLYEGLPQRTYLDGALSYIKNTGLFKKDTDAVFIMITKADKLKNCTREKLNDYINENYLGFYNGLERVCKDNEINGGVVEKIAFSLGDVCFQNYCKFDSRAAETVVRWLLKRSASDRSGKLGRFMKIVKS